MSDNVGREEALNLVRDHCKKRIAEVALRSDWGDDFKAGVVLAYTDILEEVSRRSNG